MQTYGKHPEYTVYKLSFETSIFNWQSQTKECLIGIHIHPLVKCNPSCSHICLVCVCVCVCVYLTSKALMDIMKGATYKSSEHHVCVLSIEERPERTGKWEGAGSISGHGSGVNFWIFAGCFPMLRIFHSDILIPESMIQLSIQTKY